MSHQSRTRRLMFLVAGLMVLGIGAAMYTIWDVAKQSMRR